MLNFHLLNLMFVKHNMLDDYYIIESETTHSLTVNCNIFCAQATVGFINSCLLYIPGDGFYVQLYHYTQTLDSVTGLMESSEHSTFELCVSDIL